MKVFRLITFICIAAISLALSTSPAHAAFVAENVIWTNVVNATANGNSLEKSSLSFQCIKAP